MPKIEAFIQNLRFFLLRVFFRNDIYFMPQNECFLKFLPKLVILFYSSSYPTDLFHIYQEKDVVHASDVTYIYLKTRKKQWERRTDEQSKVGQRKVEMFIACSMKEVYVLFSSFLSDRKQTLPGQRHTQKSGPLPGIFFILFSPPFESCISTII